jgi:hypothetical protein
MNQNEEINGIAYRDILLNCILGLVMMIGILILLISVKEKMAASGDVKAPGNLMVTVSWPEGDQDVDLWVYGPGEPVPVGYSNKSGVVWSLLRDDLGNYPDATPFNFENAYTRGIVAGTYWFNVHCFRCTELPIKVNVEIALNQGINGPSKSGTRIILATEVELTRNKQELTIVSFKMDGKGNIDRSSMNNVFKPLRKSWVK